MKKLSARNQLRGQLVEVRKGQTTAIDANTRNAKHLKLNFAMACPCGVHSPECELRLAKRHPPLHRGDANGRARR